MMKTRIYSVLLGVVFAVTAAAQPTSYALHFEEGNGVEWNDGTSVFNIPVKDISFETKIKINEVPTTTAFIGQLEEVRIQDTPDQLRLDRLEIRMDYVASSNGYRLVFKYYRDRNFGPPSLINLTKFTQDIPLPTVAYANGVKVEFTGNIADATLKLNGVPYTLTASSVNIPLLLLTPDKTHALGDFGSETALDAELCYFHYEIQNQFGGSGISQQFYFNEGPGNVPVSASGMVLPGSPSDFDWVESDLCQDPLADTDGDGLLDVNELNEDTDGDGLVNYLDNDDDGDGVPTSEEDPNGPQDTDGDGIADYLDTDDDNDGYYTIEEDPNGNNNPMDDDSDGDGVADYLDNLHHQDQVSVDVADYSNRVGDKRYEQSNHLGNVLTVVTDRAIVQPPTTKFPSNELIADVTSYSDYYPFGMQMPGKNASTEGYRYGFQGQEKDDELKGKGNSANFTFRMHDPRVGRFFTVDPLASKYPFYSPYQFSSNKVVAHKELEGGEELIAVAPPSNKKTLFSSVDGVGLMVSAVANGGEKLGDKAMAHSYSVAFKELKKGKIMGTNNKVYTVTELTVRDVHLIDGTVVEVEMAKNFKGNQYFSTKRVNHVEAFRAKWSKNLGAILKESGNIADAIMLVRDASKNGGLDPNSMLGAATGSAASAISTISGLGMGLSFANGAGIGVIVSLSEQIAQDGIDNVKQGNREYILNVAHNENNLDVLSYQMDNSFKHDFEIIYMPMPVLNEFLLGKIKTLEEIEDRIWADEFSEIEHTSAILIERVSNQKAMLHKIYIDTSQKEEHVPEQSKSED